MKFPTVLIDPPWEYVLWSPRGQGRCAAEHYDVQKIDWIKDLPIPGICHRDCTLLLWATNPQMTLACDVVRQWGFNQKTMLTWVKMHRAAAPRVGMGYHVRGSTEHLIIAQKGNARAPEPGDRENSVFFCPRGEHSAKPDYQYDIAELYPGPWIEIFSRNKPGLFPPRPGWTFLGNEVTGNDILVDLDIVSKLLDIDPIPSKSIPVSGTPQLPTLNLEW